MEKFKILEVNIKMSKEERSELSDGLAKENTQKPVKAGLPSSLSTVYHVFYHLRPFVFLLVGHVPRFLYPSLSCLPIVPLKKINNLV